MRARYQTTIDELSIPIRDSEVFSAFRGMRIRTHSLSSTEGSNKEKAESSEFGWVRTGNPTPVDSDFCLLHYKMFKDAAGKTLKSILMSCNTRMEPFAIPQVRELVSYDERELDKLGDADSRRGVRHHVRHH